MQVKNLIKLLEKANPEAEVAVYDNGSILSTKDAEDTLLYNKELSDEFYIVTIDY